MTAFTLRLVTLVAISVLGSGAAIADPQPDTDGDGVNDYADNCVLVQNPLQRDTDGDGFGNFCDADFDNNDIVNLRDLATMRLGFFGTDPDLNLDGSGFVNFIDLNIMKAGFFLPPGPGAIQVAPTDIELDNASVDENQPAGTAVGNLATTDDNPADTHTYTFIAGGGDTDNSQFTIDGNTLKTAAVLNFEAADNCLTSASTCSLRVQTDDGNGGQYPESFVINITDVNDDPTDIALSNSSVSENQPAGTAVGNFSTTDEDTGDSHTYSLVAGAGDTDNSQFTIDGTTLKTAAVLNHEAATDCTTSASTCSVRVQSSDGTGTFQESFIINITNANDLPIDIALSNNSVNENQPAGTAVGNFSTTDDDTGDSHTYSLVAGAGDTDNAQFAIIGNQLQTAAVLNHEAATDCTTSASTCSIRVQTFDGIGTFQESFIINIGDVNDPPVGVADDFSGAIGNTRFALVAALSGTTPVPPTVELVGTVGDNDQDEDGDTVGAVAGTVATSQGGSVTIDANGRFVYSPPAGFTGGDDTFTYTPSDGVDTAASTETVTIALTDIVWFVDDSSPNNPGLGTSDEPFRNLSTAGGPSLPGEPIFVHSGTQTTGITLKNSQSLLGEGLALVINTTTLVDAGTRPVIANPAGTAVTLGNGNTVRGLNITGSVRGIVGNAFGTLTADNMAINTSGGPGIDLSSGAGSVTFDSLGSSTSSGSGIDLNDVTGTFTLGGGAISGSSGAGIDITDSTATVTYSGTVAAGSNLAVNISGHSANSVSLSGNVTSSGQGILLNNNTGGTINLSGGMSLSTGAFTAFSATNGGTVNVTGTNTVTTTTATAVAIVDTTIGGSNVMFESITSTGAGANGILLDDTGTGQFYIAGTGASGSGGTISNKTDTAVTFNNTDGRITFNDLIIQDIGDMSGGFNTRSGHDGIHGQDVNGGLTLDNVIIRRISDNCVNGSLFSDGITASFWDGLEILNSTIEQCNRFHVAGVADTQDEGGVRIAGLTGTVTIDNNIFNMTGEHLDIFTHSSGTLNMTVTRSFFIDAYQEYNPPGAVVSVGGFCIDVTVEGSSDANVTIGGSFSNSNDFENCGTGSVRVTKDTVPAGSSNIDFIVDNNTFRVTDQTDAAGTFGNTPQGGVLLRAGPGAVTTFDGIVSNNVFGISIGPDDRISSTGQEIANADGVGGNVVLIFDSGVSQARVNNNVFNGSINAPWVNRADGNTSAAVLYQNNSYRGRDDYCCDSGFSFTVPGIPYRTQSRNGGDLDITFVNDEFEHHDQFFFAGTETLEFLTRNDSGFAGGTMCMAFQNVSSPDGYEFKETSGTLELYQGAVNNAATGPCGVPHGTPCEAEMADDLVRGGPSNHAGTGGAPTPGLNPPHVDVDAGSISIIGTACTLPSGGIFD